MTFNALNHYNSDKDDAALAGLARERRDQCPWGAPVAVEVGAWAGHSTLILADAGFIVFAVDHWQGNPGDHLGDISTFVGDDYCFKTFCENMGANLLSSVFPLRGTSELVAAVWPRNRLIDFCFINTNHEYESVLQDIRLWTPLMRKDAMLVGHDYSLQFPGVVKAVNETGPVITAGNFIWYRRIE